MRTTTYPNAMVERSSTQTTGPLAPSMTKTIPFDYVFEFKLKGKDANNAQDVVKLQDVVEISMQGVFVAVSLGYSFVLDESKVPRQVPIDNEPPGTAPIIVRANFPGEGPNQPTPLIQIAGTPNSQVTILKLSPSAKERFVLGEPSRFQEITVPLGTGERDSIPIGPQGTGIVGITDFEVPAELRAWDRDNNIIGEPLQNAVVGPDPSSGSLPKVGDKFIHIYGFRNQTATVLLLEGKTGKAFPVQSETGDPNPEFTFNEHGWQKVPLLVSDPPGSAATERPLSPGDLLMITPKFGQNDFGTPSVFAVSSRRVSDLSLGAIMNGVTSINASALRPTPRFANILRANPPLGSLSRDTLANAFEPVAGQQDISFLYSIDIVSSGRELQNKPIHNIAGLGIANGDRPFRPFAQPIAFEPRSVIRIQIEELSTLPGTLYIVLQGYKTLGTGRRPE